MGRRAPERQPSAGTAQELLGLEPFDSSRLATFTARLRQHGVLEPVTAAICQLARKLDEHGAPVDYARRRRLRRLSQARPDTAAWHRQRYILTCRASLPAAPVQEQLARLRLIELLTGSDPRYLPEPEPPGTDQLRDLTSQGYGAQDRPHHRMQRAPSGSSCPAPGSASRPRSRMAASSRTGCASNTRTASAASRTSPPATGTPVEALAATARKAGIRVRHGITGRTHPSPPSADPARSPRTSGASSPTRAPSSASEGSSPFPDSPASTTQPASSASGTPSSPARSASSRQPSAPPSCAPDQTGSH
jgi:hypothetical protein